ncbi:MAG: hypothetical protein J7559_12280 [Cohnella sp.]|nr:hypothetical protein [Cohnella sp.]
MPSKRIAYFEGEAEARDITSAIADAIVDALIPAAPESGDDFEENRWEKVYEDESDVYVTYTKLTHRIQGTYKHTNGVSYPVWKIVDNSVVASIIDPDAILVDEDGFMNEVVKKSNRLSGPEPTGRTFQMIEYSYVNDEDETITSPLAGALAVNIPDPTAPLNYRPYAVRQIKSDLEGNVFDDAGWNEFEIIAELPANWNYLLIQAANDLPVWVDSRRNLPPSTDRKYYYTSIEPAEPYIFDERIYVGTVNAFPRTTVLACTPDAPGAATPETFHVMLQRPVAQYNYFNVMYGKGFNGSSGAGDPEDTYTGICDPGTIVFGKVPTIINMKKAEDMYLAMSQPDQTVYTPPTFTWDLDDSGVFLVSPPAHFFFGADATVPWMVNKKRRRDYKVNYILSVNNNHCAIMLEGDPSPDIEGYYRNFGYIGQIVGFNSTDYVNNFGVTVGMGDLALEKTGFVAANIKPEQNPTIYGIFGRYTATGMQDMSMMKTRSGVPFQAYYPAFVTQLPDYPNVGSIPPELSKLVIEQTGFQASAWTKKYHASPIYLAHLFEGYRGYLDGVVAIGDHNIVNQDELIVDTEEPKDPEHPEAGNWEEVYKFISLKSPVNFFKRSANPAGMAVAILKEVR